MNDEPTTAQADKPQTTTEAWQEVGNQFRALGESLAAAMRTTWQSEENRQRVQEMRASLEAMVNEIGQAVKESAASPQAQQARAEANRAFESVRTASEQTIQEVRPQIISALRQVNDELSRLIGRMEQAKPPVTEARTEPPVTDASQRPTA